MNDAFILIVLVLSVAMFFIDANKMTYEVSGFRVWSEFTMAAFALYLLCRELYS